MKEPRMLRRRTATFIAVGAVLTVAALGAGGWAVMTSMDHSFTFAAAAPSKTSTAAPTPVDEEEAAKLAAEKATKGLTVGAVLTAEQAKAIVHYWQGNLVPYKMSDGSQVLIARDQPLPENVKADAGKKLTAAAQAAANSGDVMNVGIERAQKNAAYELGHQVIVVVRAYTVIDPDSGNKGWTWYSSAGNGVQFDSTEAAIAASNPVPAGTEIIVSQ